MAMAAWLSTYIINFWLNLLIPAVSPRIYIEHKYSGELTGFGIANAFRSLIKSQSKGSYGAFPSGHVASSWIAGFVSVKYFKTYGKISLFSAVMITLATVYLRYHYFVDVIGAIPLVFFGMFYGGYWPEPKIVQKPLLPTTATHSKHEQ
jgi:membrane-associated phospholipid phosphatase